MNKGFLHALAIATPILAALLYFALQGREDVKNSQAETRIEQQIEAKKFDQDFAQAWNGKGKLKAPTDKEINELKAERDEIKAHNRKKDQEQEQDFSDLRAAINDAASTGDKK